MCHVALHHFLALVLSLACLTEPAAFAQPPRADRIGESRPLFGLDRIGRSRLADADPHRDPPGRPMHLVDSALRPAAGRSVTRLDAGVQRAACRSRSRTFATGRRSRPSAWRRSGWRRRSGEGCKYRRYQSKWFALDSTVDEQDTRGVIVRAEQVSPPHRQIMPPRTVPVQTVPGAAAATDRAGIDGRISGRVAGSWA